MGSTKNLSPKDQNSQNRVYNLRSREATLQRDNAVNLMKSLGAHKKSKSNRPMKMPEMLPAEDENKSAGFIRMYT